MGVIRKIGRKWYVDLRADGRRVRKVVGSRRDAERALTAIEADVLRGTYRFKRETRTRFDDFAESYLEHSKANKRSWQRDRTSLKSLSGCFGDMLLSKINAGHIEKYKSLRIAEVSPASVNRELACLSALFTLAKKSKLVDENPAREVQNLQERKIAMKVLNEEEARRLVDVSTGSLKSIVIIALNTGMRSGEIFSMRWNDVDFDQHFIFIKMTKSGVARKVPMNAVVAAALKTMKREGEFVFVNPKTGRPLTTVHRSFKSACTKARINDLRFHDLRHTAASWMVMGGVDLVTVAQILGHSDIKMTMRYAHPTPAARRQAVDVLAAAFGQKGHDMVKNWSKEEEAAPVTYLVSKN